MIDETCLDLEAALKKQNPHFFEELPKNFSSEKYNSGNEVAENFCFLNVVFIKSQMRTNNQEKELCKKIIRNLESMNNHISYIHKLLGIFNTKKEVQEPIIFEILTRDNSFIYILANLDLYEPIEQNNIKKIFKTLIKKSKNYTSVNEKVRQYLLINANAIANLTLDILNRAIDESIIYNVVKIVKFLFEDSWALTKVLNFEFFKRIYNLTKSEKFVYSTEAFKTLCSLVENEDLDKDLISNFFEENQEEICKLFNSSLSLSIDKDDEELYLFKRESLKFLTLILKPNDFQKFTEYYFNQKENLMTIMSLLNHSCTKIKYKAIEILYICFVDIEYRNDIIKALVLKNKTNFEKYFDKITEIFHDEDLIEKKNFILYELEKLKNSE